MEQSQDSRYNCSVLVHQSSNPSLLCLIIFSGPNRGIPNNLAEQNDHTSRISSTQIPSTDDAVASFIASGGNLSPIKLFGIDPLSGSSSLIQQRQLELEESIPCPQEIFAHTVNGDYSSFAHSLEFLIESTTRLQRQL